MKNFLNSCLVVASLLIFLLCFVILQSKNSERATENFFDSSTVSARQSIDITIQSQPNSPLKISSAINNSTDANVAEVTFVLENLGKKPVDAYAIQYNIVCGGSKSGGVELSNILTKAKVLQPGQTIQNSISDFGCSVPITALELSTDFVEFIGGKRWGDDKSKSGERLSGMREGAKDEAVALLSAIKERGTKSVLDTLELDEVSWSTPTGHSSEWVNGYNTGRKFRRNQIRHAKSTCQQNEAMLIH